jgi:signal transduction histidine kinase
MRSFLGVPIVARGEVIGALYLTEKAAASLLGDDEQLIELLAAHAAIAIENARLHERSRELSIIEERNRLARELHDNVTQRLFGVALAAESASTLLERDREAAAAEMARVGELARAAMEELRAVVFELRPGVLGGRGAGDRAAQARRRAAAGLRAADRAPCRRGAAAGAGARDAGAADRAGGARERAAARGGLADRRAAGERGRAARVERERRRRGFDPRRRGARARLGLTSMEERATSSAGR